MTSSLLSITNLGKSFKTQNKTIAALSNFNLNLEEGKMVALVGADGSGKTTLFKAVCGITQTFRGDCGLVGLEGLGHLHAPEIRTV